MFFSKNNKEESRDNFLPNFLSYYFDADFLSQMKAQFLYKVSITAVIIVSFLITSTVFLQIFYLDGFNITIVAIEILCWLFMMFSIMMVKVGKLNLAMHSWLMMSFATVWAVIIFEDKVDLARFDSISFTFGILAMTPLVAGKKKSIILIYSIINVLILFCFSYYLLHFELMPKGQILDYLIDNTISYILTATVAYNIYIIYQKALRRSETAMLDSKKAEAEVLKLNEELEGKVLVRTQELNEALSVIEIANLELNELNENMAQEAEKLIILNEKLTESEQELKNANQTKDKFFSIIAHDLRNPFVPLITGGEMLENYYFDLSDEEKLRLISDMRTASKNVYSLLENLLQWSMAQMGKLEFTREEINLYALVLKTKLLLQAQADKKNISIDVNLPVELMIFADFNMINTIIRNLITNAIKFTPEKGHIEVGAKLISTDLPATSYHCIYVKDDGIGMSSEIIGHLFKLDQKVSRPGTKGEFSTGLGLLLCKDFVEQHGGKIWAESEEGKGSVFNFTLPKE